MLDATTGGQLMLLDEDDVGGVDLYEGSALLSDHVLAVWNPDSQTCGVVVSAYEMSTGETLWRNVLGQWHSSSTGEELTCESPLTVATDAAGGLFAFDEEGNPEVLDVESGKALWTGQQGDCAFARSGDVVVARTNQGNGDLVGYDSATGERVWTIALSTSARDSLSPAMSTDFAIVEGHLGFTITRVETVSPGGNGSALSNRIVMFDASSGTAIWTSTARVSMCGMTATGVFGYASTILGTADSYQLRYFAV